MNNQVALFEHDSDDALFVDREDAKKRYTAKQFSAIEAKRELILLCVGAGMPVEAIARAGGVNVRTVQALAANNAQQVAGNREAMVAALQKMGMRWLGLAQAREGDAKFSELVVGMGIAIQRGNELALLGMDATDKTIQLEEAKSDIQERVKRLLKKNDELRVAGSVGKDAKNVTLAVMETKG